MTSLTDGISGQRFNNYLPSVEETVKSAKESSYYQEVQGRLTAERDQKGLWVKAKDNRGATDYYLDVSKLSSKSFFTTIKTHEGTIKVPMVIKMALGQKIQLKDKIESMIEGYKKAVLQSTSHNLIISRVGGMKMSAIAFVLSMLGTPPEEIKKLKKQAIEDAIAENIALFEENIYNLELFETLGGGNNVKAKAQRSILDEIQKQILTQAKRLNMEAYYTKEKILEFKINACKDILYKFKEEQSTLQYELDYYTSVHE